ncbi:MAG: hypothetical protein WCB31_00645 [Nitrososphaeraceae archaeon]
MEVKPNTWLISNSQLYFANSIVNEKDNSIKEKNRSLSPYSLFDLSNLLECILLADKIITLPGRGIENYIAEILKREDILYELDIKKDIANIIGSLKSTWDEDSIIHQHRDKFVNVLCNIFPIEKEIANNAVSKANEWASTTYRTPSYDLTRAPTIASIRQEDLTPMLGHDTNALFKEYKNTHPETIEEIVIETFVRAILYFKIASARKLNYYPDSIRTPITACLSNLLEATIYRFVKKILTEIDEKITKQLDSNYARIGFTKTEVIIPSSFSNIIARCNNRDEIIEKALELRKSNDLKKCRQWLSDYETASKTMDINKIKSMTEQLILVQNPKDYDIESLIIQSIPSISDVVSLDITKSSERGVSALANIGINNLLKYLKTKNLIFFRNLSTQYDQIISSKKHIEEIFESNLSNEGIEILKSLKESQSEYIHPRKKEP